MESFCGLLTLPNNTVECTYSELFNAEEPISVTDTNLENMWTDPHLGIDCSLNLQDRVESDVAASGNDTTSPDGDWNEPHASLRQNGGYVAANGTASDANFAFDRDSRWPFAHALEDAGDGTVNGGFHDTITALNWSLPDTATNWVHVGIDTHDNILANNSLAISIATLAPDEHRERKACTHFGCTATFGRSSDLRRHAGMHFAPKLLCHFGNCKKKFYRYDKLRDHQRKMHKMAVRWCTGWKTGTTAPRPARTERS